MLSRGETAGPRSLIYVGFNRKENETVHIVTSQDPVARRLKALNVGLFEPFL